MASRSDTMKIIRAALSCPHGWRKLPDSDSRGHIVLELPNGRRESVSMSPSDVHAGRNLATRLARTCGCESFWGRAGTGRRSRKADSHTDFDPSRAARANERFHALGTDRTELPERHALLVAELRELNPRRHPDRVADIASEICDMERRMDAAHIYYRKATE